MLLRLVFHDAGTYAAASGDGGANGSLRFELDRPENRGLKVIVLSGRLPEGNLGARRCVRDSVTASLFLSFASSMCLYPALVGHASRATSNFCRKRAASSVAVFMPLSLRAGNYSVPNQPYQFTSMLGDYFYVTRLSRAVCYKMRWRLCAAGLARAGLLLWLRRAASRGCFSG